MVFLADYALQSRWRALLLTVASAGSLLFCWIGAALVALITLRKGVQSGAWLVMWAVLPAVTVMYYTGDASALSLLLGSFVLALVLRVTVSLPLTLLVSIAIGGLVGVAMYLFATDQIAAIREGLEQMLTPFNDELAKQKQPLIAAPGALQVAGMLGLFTSVGSILCLLLARYWQASLFNPGGFGDEFRALRLPQGLAASLILASVVLSVMLGTLGGWAMLILVPLHVAGLAVVHAYAKASGRSSVWLAVFYVLWLLLEPIKLSLVFLALADSWFDLRQRFINKGGNTL